MPIEIVPFLPNFPFSVDRMVTGFRPCLASEMLNMGKNGDIGANLKAHQVPLTGTAET